MAYFKKAQGAGIEVSMEKKTALYEAHLACEGKIVPFAGYLLPVQYKTGVVTEHMAVRKECGLFDVSHMGEVLCSGKDALKNLNYILTNRFDDMYDGQARYSPMCNEKGGVVDDLIVYKIKENHYFIVVNASNKDKDVAWLKAHAFGEVVFEDISERVAQIALQGPKSKEILAKLAAAEDIPTKYYSACFDRQIHGMKCIISRTGYTGEYGYEIYLANQDALKLWDLFLETGKEYGLIPCGLGARDTLRLEASMPLYGHEMDDEITPFEADFDNFIDMGKDFIGKEALLAKGEPTRKRIGIKVTGRGIVREQAKVFADGKEIGITTSGTHCPYLGYPVAMALLDLEYRVPGTKVVAEVRGRKIEAEVVSLPFYKK